MIFLSYLKIKNIIFGKNYIKNFNLNLKKLKAKFKETRAIETERKQKQEEELVDIRKRFMVLFL